MAEPVGAVGALWRFPVKSMLGEKLESADITACGLAGDRAYALVDAENGQVVNAKYPRIGLSLLTCRAEFVEAPRAGDEAPPVRVTFPDGTSVRSDAADADARLASFFGHPVKLERSALDSTIDQYNGYLEQVRTDLLAEGGLPATIRLGAYFDLLHVSVLTTSTLGHLHEVSPESRFDERRFRMNVTVDTELDAFAENEWPGQRLQLGDEVRLRVSIPVPRCVMTTMAQEELPKDPAVLRTVGKQNRIHLAGKSYPCLGAYATVETAGTVRAGDTVSLT